MTASEPASAAITRRLEAAGAANAVLVGVHPGSVWFTKRWPAERFAALIKKLSASGARAVLVGGKGDRQLCADVIAASGTDAINWAGETSLPELMAIMPRLKLFITNDSGPMEEYLVKFNSYTSLAAEKMRQSGKKFHCWNLLTPPLEFLKRYVLRLGFLDGVAGLAWSGASAFYVFVKHIKLWQLEREAEQDND